MSTRFAPRSGADLVQLIDEHPLAWVVSGDFQATPLPLLADCRDGAVVSLVGHFARRNPQVEALRREPRALVLFQGPQGYVSPRLVSKPAWGPTWNYAVVRFEVRIEFLEEELDELLDRLARRVERDHARPWTPAEMGARYAELRRYIIGFRAHVQTAHATFKLGQDEDEATFAEITGALEGTPLARWMRAQHDRE